MPVLRLRNKPLSVQPKSRDESWFLTSSELSRTCYKNDDSNYVVFLNIFFLHLTT
mgnify:CR=1 FL=1